MPLSPLLADWLKAKGHDAVHAIHLAMGRALDSDILERARLDWLGSVAGVRLAMLQLGKHL